MSNDRLVIDQMGRSIRVPIAPRRIISLVPSQTELLIDLGLEDRLVGRTKFCIHPAEKVDEVPIVGGTKQFNMATIDKLKPDLIIGNKEENEQIQIEELALKYPVWMSDIYMLEDALRMIGEIGGLLGSSVEADAMAHEIEEGFKSVEGLINGRAAYLIWDRPIMAVGPDTFIHDMMTRLGLINTIEELRYPEVPIEELQKSNPDYLLLSSEPYPYKEKHIKSYEKLMPETKVLLVDGEMFSWYGSRLLSSVAYFKELASRIKAG